MPPTARLEITRGPLSGTQIPLQANRPVLVGRGRDASVTIEDERMSRRHFEIEWDGAMCRLHDLGSANGTTLNGRKVTDAIARHGDSIGAGQCTFTVEVSESDTAAEPSTHAEPPAPSPVGEPPQPPEPAGAPAEGREPASPGDVSLRILKGPRHGETFSVPVGGQLTMGRASSCTLAVDDIGLSREHLRITWDGRACKLVDLGSTNGTKVNRAAAAEALLQDGDEIAASKTVFLVRVPERAAVEAAEREAAPEPEVFPRPVFGWFAPEPRAEAGLPADRLLARALAGALGAAPGGDVYAIVDGAQALELAVTARRLGCEVYTLFSGAMATSLAHVGPCLFRIEALPAFLAPWVDAIGSAAGVLLVTDADLESLAGHLREVFVVQDEEGQEYFFRYYDPRVLRVFLPTCRPKELKQFFGPVRLWVAENQEGKGYVCYSAAFGSLTESPIEAPRPAGDPGPTAAQASVNETGPPTNG